MPSDRIIAGNTITDDDPLQTGDAAIASGRSFKAVAPSDSVDLPDGPCRALNCSAAGAISVIGADDTDAVTITVVAGWNPAAVKRVRTGGDIGSITVVAVY